MVDVFGDSIASRSGNLQVAKKVVATLGKFKAYNDEIQQSYVLGFTPYRLHKNVDSTFVTPRYMYWTMLPRWRLAIDILERIQ